MGQSATIEISSSKGKLTKALVTSLAFVLIGCWLVIYQPAVRNPAFNNPAVKTAVGVATILFFGIGVIYFSRKLFDKSPGIVIDEKGILDNSSAAAAGFIPWSDIKQFATAKLMKQEFLIIVVNNPEHYLSKQTNFLKKKGMEYNNKNYGSPLAISANGLNCNLKELTSILESKLSEYKTYVELHQ